MKESFKILKNTRGERRKGMGKRKGAKETIKKYICKMWKQRKRDEAGLKGKCGGGWI